jgi:hypothetical protein
MVPFGWMTIIASDLIALRSRRSRTEELFVSLPSPYSVRTAGFLLLIPVAFVAALVVLLAGGGAVVGFLAHDFSGEFAWTEIAAGAFIVAGSVGLGVAVARWLPGAVWGVVAVFATVFLQARFLDTATWPWNSTQSDLRRFLGFLAAPTSAPGFEVRRPVWHLVYLVGLVVLISVVALSRHGWNRRVIAGGLAVALLVAVIAGIAQTRPPSDAEVARMVAVLENPSSAQVCTTDDDVTYCAYQSTPPERIQQWRDRVDAVLAAVPPASVRRRLEVRQRASAIVGTSACAPGPFVEALPREVASALHPDRVWPDDGHVHPALGPDSFWCDGGEPLGSAGDLFVATQTGAWAVGLPPAPHGDDVRCTADGQARSVLALWLGAQATPDGAARLRRTLVDGGDGTHLTFLEWDERPVLGVTYATNDVLTALAILGVPTDEVIPVVRANWATFVDPQTPASAFARLFSFGGAEAPGSAGSAPCP